MVAITTRPLWSYVTDAISAFILSVLPPLEVPSCMGDLEGFKDIMEDWPLHDFLRADQLPKDLDEK